MKKNTILYISVTIFFLVLTTIFVYRYVKNESPVYIYDYSGYHEMYKRFSNEFMTSKRAYIKEVISSIRNSDYNCSPIVLLLPFYMIFKASRFGYILGCSLLYVIPTMILTIVLTKKMIFKEYSGNKEDNKFRIMFTIFLCIVSFLYTRWWSPTLRGLPDIIAVIPLTCAGLIVLKHSFIEKQKIYIPMTIGFLMYLCFLFRRYFIYCVIGFYLSLFIKEFIRFLKISDKEERKEKFINAFKNFLIAGLTTIFCVLILQLPLVKNILQQNYKESYSAYQDTFLNHIVNTVDEFGIVILIFVAIGIIYTLCCKKHRKNGIFCLTNIFICYGTFATVQGMGVHHYLAISVWMFILFIYGVYGICEILKNKLLQNFFLIGIILIMSINFSTTYIFRDTTIPIISQRNKYCKFYYENFEELERLIGDIDKIVSEKNTKFSVFASSYILSDNILELLGTDNMKKSIVYPSIIDLRDGMSFDSLLSEYIIVTNIPQTGTSVEGQRVISVPNNEIVNRTSIGKAYEKISDEYVLCDGIKAYIFKKTRGFTEEEVNEFMYILESYYPEWKEKYTVSDYSILIEK